MQIADEMIREPGSEESIRSQPALRSPLADLRGHDVVIVSHQYWADYWVSKH